METPTLKATSTYSEKGRHENEQDALLVFFHMNDESLPHNLSSSISRHVGFDSFLLVNAKTSI